MSEYELVVAKGETSWKGWGNIVERGRGWGNIIEKGEHRQKGETLLKRGNIVEKGKHC